MVEVWCNRGSRAGLTQGKDFQNSYPGLYKQRDVIIGISDFEFTLKDLGYKFQMGTGVAKTLEV